MPHGKRKVPFSCKRKKEQIIQKRQVNKSNLMLRKNSSDDSDDDNDAGEYQYGKLFSNVKSLNKQPAQETNRNPNKYNLQFHEESKKELQEMKKAARQPFQKVDCDEIDDNYFDGYDFPKRPGWHYKMSKEELSRNENRYFKEYIDELMKTHQQNSPNVTSVFELNLETWRQLWRVIEMSDVLLIVVDARYPSLMFPPDLFNYLDNQLKKSVILILNKIDLISPECALAWKNYFTEKYKGIYVVYFASYSRPPQKNRKYYLKQKSLVCGESIKKICDICKEIVSCHDIDLTGWEQKILEDAQLKDDEKLKIDQNHIDETASITGEYDESCTNFKNGILTIGCIGFPNVGKSSLINSLKGKKVVSVSKTPGHTKHFQTIFLTENVKLCDSPGLVFPSKTPKYLQVLIGSFPIAQLKEPNRSLMYAGERIDLSKILNINLPPDFDHWSAVAVCEAWCFKRGFLTAKASRPDHYRAANNLLRMILEGKIVIQIFPPQFQDRKNEFLKDTNLEDIRRIQGCEIYNIYDKNSSEDGIKDVDNGSNEETDSDSKESNVADKKGNQSTSQGVCRGNFFDLLESD